MIVKETVRTHDGGITRMHLVGRPQTADGVALRKGNRVCQISTSDGGRRWYVRACSSVITRVHPKFSLAQLDKQPYWWSMWGDNRLFSSSAAAAAECRRRNAVAAVQTMLSLLRKLSRSQTALSRHRLRIQARELVADIANTARPIR